MRCLLEKGAAHVRRQAEQGLALFRDVGERDGTSVALYTLGVDAHASGECKRAREMFEEGMALAAAVRDETIVEQPRICLCHLHGNQHH